MTKKKKRTRRSDIKVMTKEASVLKYLRQSKKLSMREAGRICGLSCAQINHAENGRMDLNPSLILKILDGYGTKWVDFLKLVDGKRELPGNEFQECVEILKRLNKEKLTVAKRILESL
jgi:transcriptional regulator with XRE-family HTH domain